MTERVGSLRTIEEWRKRAVELMHAGERGGPAVIEANAAILDLDRTDDDARTRLGYAYRLEGDFDSAEAVYDQILTSSSAGSQNHQIARRALGRIKDERSGTPVSLLAAQLASVVNADDAYQRASALRDAGRDGPDGARKLATALGWVNRGLELAERQGRAKLRRGLAVRVSIRRAQKDLEGALADARASVDLGLGYEDNPSAFVVLTACLMDLDEIAEAVEIAARYLESDTDNRYAMNAAGRAFIGQSVSSGELDFMQRGERCFRRVLELAPNPSARIQLGRLAERYRAMSLGVYADDLERFLLDIAN